MIQCFEYHWKKFVSNLDVKGWLGYNQNMIKVSIKLRTRVCNLFFFCKISSLCLGSLGFWQIMSLPLTNLVYRCQLLINVLLTKKALSRYNGNHFHLFWFHGLVNEKIAFYPKAKLISVYLIKLFCFWCIWSNYFAFGLYNKLNILA